MKLSSFRKFLYILSWVPVAIIHIALILLGLIVVPVALHLSEGKQDQWPDLLWVWGNDEEFVPDWWLDHASLDNWYTKSWPRWWWFAVRNPVNNFRFIFKDREADISGNWTEPRMEAQDLLDRNMRVAYRWTYNGLFAGYRCVWITVLPEAGFESRGEYSELWVGWKIDSIVPGMGFTLQYRRNREIGK